MAESAGEQIAAALSGLFGTVRVRQDIRALWQALGGPRGGTAALVERLGLPRSTRTERRSSMRRIQRYVTEAGQKRGAKLPPDIAEKLRVVSRTAAYDRAERDGLVILVLRGQLRVSRDRRLRTPKLSGEPLDPYGVSDMLAAYEGMHRAKTDGERAVYAAELEQAFDIAQGDDWGGYFGGHWEDFEALEFSFGDEAPDDLSGEGG